MMKKPSVVMRKKPSAAETGSDAPASDASDVLQQSIAAEVKKELKRGPCSRA